jgi:hypothetical protein
MLAVSGDEGCALARGGPYPAHSANRNVPQLLLHSTAPLDAVQGAVFQHQCPLTPYAIMCQGLLRTHVLSVFDIYLCLGYDFAQGRALIPFAALLNVRCGAFVHCSGNDAGTVSLRPLSSSSCGQAQT